MKSRFNQTYMLLYKNTFIYCIFLDSDYNFSCQQKKKSIVLTNYANILYTTSVFSSLSN